MRLATWNVWGRFGDEWRQRQPVVAETLAEIDADVVCLQEVWGEEAGDAAGGTAGFDQAEHLAGELGMNFVRSPHRFHRGRSLGNAVLSRTPIVADAVHSLAVGRHARNRTAVVAHVQRAGAADGDVVPVVCTHLEHRFGLGDVRRRQVLLLWEIIESLHDESRYPVVLAGDLNADAGSDEIRLLTGESAPPGGEVVMNDAWAQAGDGPGHTWSRANPHLRDAMWPNRRIDYVMVSVPRPVPHGNVEWVRLAGDEPRGGVTASDHYAVVVSLTD